MSDPTTGFLTHPTMYIAGLNLPFTESQALNALACASVTASFWSAWPRSSFRKQAETKAGKAVHMPAGKRGELITIAHNLTLFAPITLFLVTVPLNKFTQPDWLAQHALPEVSLPTYYAARVGASAFIWLSGMIVKASIKHLDAQFNYIGVRERPKLVKTGPYRVTRHPMYSCMMLSMAGMAGAFWSWIPVPALGLLAIIFAVKIPMEENIILRHEDIGPEYAAYKKQVPWRVIPYICFVHPNKLARIINRAASQVAELFGITTMYIAGLTLPFTAPQALNSIAWVSLAGSFYLSWPGAGIKKKAEQEAGNAVHMPAGQKGLYITIAHSLALFGPTALLLSVLPLNKFIEPDWLGKYALPKVSPLAYYATRIGSSVLMWVSGAIMTRCFKHLGAQWNYIGVRERPALVNTGPYKVVRHPMYSCVMLAMAGTAGAFWNWIPVAALGVLMILFAIKMPMEESVIIRANAFDIGFKYYIYKGKVPYRIIPYIW